MATVRLTERFAFSGGKVDRTGAYPVVKDVLLCGPTSANRRRYKAEAFAGDRVKRYNGRPVFLNHGKGRQSRDYQDKIGSIENARLRADGMPIGDIAINPKTLHAEAFLHDAEHHPNACGMSHVAQCRTKTASDGWEEVEEIVEAESVDVVVDPATTNGLYENRGTTVPTTIKEYLNTLAPKCGVEQLLKVKRLLKEYDDSAMLADAPAPESAEAGDGVTAAVKAAASQEIDDCLANSTDPAAVKRCLKRLKKILHLHGDLSDEDDEDEDDTDTETDAEPPKESKSRKAKAITEAMAACDKASFRPSGTDLALVAAVTAEQRPGLIERLRKTVEGAGKEPPQSAGKKPGAGGAGKTTTTTEEKPKRRVPAWN